jgi:hypothetical protein
MQLTQLDAHRHSITTRSGEISYIDTNPAGVIASPFGPCPSPPARRGAFRYGVCPNPP